MTAEPKGRFRRTTILKLCTVLAVGAIVLGVRSTGALRQTAASPQPKPATAGKQVVKNSDANTGSTTLSPSPQPESTSFRDGTYTAAGSYTIPTGETESIGISLTVASDTVTGTSAVSYARNPQSRTYQADFIARYKAYVVGKKLSDLQLSRVSGSSLTPMGFNQAAGQIASQAKL